MPDQLKLDRISLILLGCILFTLTLRCVIGTDPFPYASTDVFTNSAPPLSLTPKWCFVLDAFTLLASAGLFITHIITNRFPAWWQSLALCLAGLILLAHINPRSTDAMDNALLGIHWLSNFTAAVALMPVLRANLRARALTIATLIAIALATSFRGVYQFQVEHAQTMATFNATKDSYFASQGWTPESPMARAFTRRISQAEATGWFGFANVAATIFAAGTSLMFPLLLATSIKHKSREPVPGLQRAAIWLGTLALIFGVIFAGSKGGIAALLLGLTIGTTALFANSPVPKLQNLYSRLAAFLAPALIALVFLAILARGLIGERIAELSILFRSMYIDAAARIFAHNPILGTGPAGFKDAYLLAKNPANPEEIALPHSVLFDLLATLGIAGLALAALWLFFAWRAGSALAPREEPATTLDSRDLAKPLFFILAFAAIAAGYIERAAPLIDMVGLRIAALAIAGIIAAAAVLVMLRMPRIAAISLVAASCAFIAQSQIELTATNPGSMLWGLLLLACAAAYAPDLRTRTPQPLTSSIKYLPTPKHTTLLAILLCGIYTLGCGFWWMKSRSWESSLRRAADAAEPVRDFTQRRNDLATRTPSATAPTDSTDLLRQDLSKYIDRAVPATPAGIDSALIAARQKAIPQVADALERAARTNGSHLGTVRAFVTVQMMDLAAHLETGDATPDQLNAPILSMRQFGEPLSKKTTYWSWLGTIYAERAQRNEGTRDADLRAAIDNWTRAHDLAPHNTLHAIKISDTYAQLNDPPNAKRWAQIALAQNTNLRLDPLTQLTDLEQKRLIARTK